MTLRELAGHLKIGTAVNHDALTKDLEYQKVLATQFNLLVPENAMKCHVICPTPDTYDFTAADTIIDWAAKHEQFVRGHVLCWHLSYAKWMRGLTSLELEKVLKNYIFATVERYRGKCYAWDVLSEAIDDKGKPRRSIWRSIENYIQKCFLWAHEADPDAQLIYLDYRIHAQPRWNAVCKMLDELKDEGIPIHGVGLQLHHELFRAIGLSILRLPGLIQHLKQLGVAVHFSEISLPIYPPTQQLPDSTKYAFQAQAYGQLMKVCLESGGSSFTVWGCTDRYAFYKPPEYDTKATPCLFDVNHQPKPAFLALERELSKNLSKFSLKSLSQNVWF